MLRPHTTMVVGGLSVHDALRPRDGHRDSVPSGVRHRLAGHTPTPRAADVEIEAMSPRNRLPFRESRSDFSGGLP